MSKLPTVPSCGGQHESNRKASFVSYTALATLTGATEKGHVVGTQHRSRGCGQEEMRRGQEKLASVRKPRTSSTRLGSRKHLLLSGEETNEYEVGQQAGLISKCINSRCTRVSTNSIIPSCRLVALMDQEVSSCALDLGRGQGSKQRGRICEQQVQGRNPLPAGQELFQYFKKQYSGTGAYHVNLNQPSTKCPDTSVLSWVRTG